MSNVFRDALLSKKTAFVTGGGSGIGLAIAQRFAQHGARVVLAGRNSEKLEQARNSIELDGGTARIASLDVRNYQAVESAFERIRDELGEVDIVVAAAAGNFLASAARMSANAFKAVIDIDLLGTFNTMRAAYAQLRRPGASLLAISAAHATVPVAFQSHVCAAKAGVELLAKTLALEWGPEGVRCNCITPGATADTEGFRRLLPTPEIQQQGKSGIPLRRFGTRDEIADVALFLCSEAATYITGTTIVCDGGSSLTRSNYSFESAWHATAQR
jgi:NAD(P)-dependent dehydrogenase (short-subunit alcohol dehydrogenase family)